MNLSAKNRAEYEALGLPCRYDEESGAVISSDNEIMCRFRFGYAKNGVAFAKAANSHHALLEEVERLKPAELETSIIVIDDVPYPAMPQVAGLLHAVSEERDDLKRQKEGGK